MGILTPTLTVAAVGTCVLAVALLSSLSGRSASDVPLASEMPPAAVSDVHDGGSALIARLLPRSPTARERVSKMSEEPCVTSVDPTVMTQIQMTKC